MSRSGIELLNSNRVRKALKEKWQDIDGVVRCINCCATPIQWDHVVALEDGGNDVFSNIVPLCSECHLKKHSMKLRKRKTESVKNRVHTWGGAPRKLPENYKDLLHDYIFCKFGKKELGRRWNSAMGIDNGKMPDAVSHISDKVWFSEYLDELGIEKQSNRIDMHTSKRHPKNYAPDDTQEIGTIVYKNGKVEKFCYADVDRPKPMPKSRAEKPRSKFEFYHLMPKNYKELLNDYVFCHIGERELREKWDVDPVSVAGLFEFKKKPWYLEYLDEIGVKQVVNKIDKPSATFQKLGLAGYIVHKTGEREYFEKRL